VQREAGVGRAESGTEVIFEGANLLFGGIAAMDAGWSKLKMSELWRNVFSAADASLLRR
jgi:hypothetical protein